MSQRPMEEAYSKFVCNDNKTGWAARDFFDAGWQAALSQSELTLLRSKLNVDNLTDMVRYYGYVTYKPAREIAELILKELS